MFHPEKKFLVGWGGGMLGCLRGKLPLPPPPTGWNPACDPKPMILIHSTCTFDLKCFVPETLPLFFFFVPACIILLLTTHYTHTPPARLSHWDVSKEWLAKWSSILCLGFRSDNSIDLGTKSILMAVAWNGPKVVWPCLGSYNIHVAI